MLIPAFVLCGSSAFADSTSWQVRKSSGEVWVTTSGAVQQVSLTQDASLKSGDSIRTGRNGRALLIRGEETILISPNSVIGLPADKDGNLSTTIVQQAGSILLDVEKRNVKHFQVETPYLAAVVKGTQFRVSVSAAGADVSVIRGQVEVADFRSGQIAQVMRGQTAASAASGRPGLSLTGEGTLSPIQNGRPRAPTVERISVPKAGLSAPKDQRTTHTRRASTSIGPGANSVAARSNGNSSHARNGLRISAPIGEVRLNIHRSSNGLAHAAGTAASGDTGTSWNARGPGHADGANGNQNGNSSGAVAPASSVAAAPVSNNGTRGNNGNGGANVNGIGGGNGNAYGHGNGNGNGRGNGNAHGHANGNGNGRKS